MKRKYIFISIVMGMLFSFNDAFSQLTREDVAKFCPDLKGKYDLLKGKNAKDLNLPLEKEVYKWEVISGELPNAATEINFKSVKNQISPVMTCTYEYKLNGKSYDFSIKRVPPANVIEALRTLGIKGEDYSYEEIANDFRKKIKETEPGKAMSLISKYAQTDYFMQILMKSLKMGGHK